MDHVSTVLGIPYRILRDICLDVAQRQVVAGIEHTAVCVAASLAQIIPGLLSGCHKHLRSVKMLCQQGL